MSFFHPANTFTTPSALPHPSLCLPHISRATSASALRFQYAEWLSRHFKTDSRSLAEFVRNAYQRGWLSSNEVAALSTSDEKLLALLALSEKAASFVAEHCSLEAVIDKEAIKKQLGGMPLGSTGIQAISHACRHLGIMDNDTLLNALRSMTNIEHQFTPFIDDVLDNYLAQQTASLLNLPLDAVTNRHVSIGLEAYEGGALVSAHNVNGLSLFYLYLPTSDTPDAILLRDTLCLLSDVLQEFDLYHQEPGLIYAGGHLAEDDANDIKATLAGEAVTQESVLEVVRDRVLKEYLGAGNAKEDIEALLNDTDALLTHEDMIDFTTDMFPSLIFRNSLQGQPLAAAEWAQKMADLCNDDHWSRRAFIPPHLRRQTAFGGEVRQQKEARWQAIAAYFTDAVSAVEQQLSSDIPDTVAELKRIAGWLTRRVREGVLDVYLEDMEAQDGTPFEMTFMLAAGLASVEEEGTYHYPLSMNEADYIGEMEDEANNCGISPRMALASLEDDFDTVEKLFEIAVSYDALGTALERLSVAREKESARIS